MRQPSELYDLLGINLDEYEIISIIPKIKEEKRAMSYEEVKRIMKEIYDLNLECNFIGSHSLAELLKDDGKYSNVFDIVCKHKESVKAIQNYLKNKGYKEVVVADIYSIEIVACNKKHPQECIERALPTCFGEVSLEKDGIRVNLFYEGMICIKYQNRSIDIETFKYVENARDWTIAYKLIRGKKGDLEHLRKLIEKGISIEEILLYVERYESYLKEIYPDYKERLKRNLKKLQKI